MKGYSPDELLRAERNFASARGIDPAQLNIINDVRRQLAGQCQASLHKVAAFIVAPVLYGFTQWIATELSNIDDPLPLGVMREGQFICRMLRSLYGIQSEEIWLNRDSSMRAAFACGDDEALINWLSRTRLMPLTCAEAYRNLLGRPCPEEIAQKRIDTETAYSLLATWKSDGSETIIKARANEIKSNLLKSWSKATKNHSDPVVLMDFAAAGNIQRSLLSILKSSNINTSIIGLNFATTKGTVWAKNAGCNIKGYISEDGLPDWMANAYARTPEIIEIFSASPLGALIGYADDGEPMLGQCLISSQQTVLVNEAQELIIKSAHTYNDALCGNLSRETAQLIWGRLLLDPLGTEADALADWPLDAGIDGTNARVMAPDIPGNPEEWTKIQSAWPAGSAIRHKSA